MIESRLRNLELAVTARFGVDDRPPGVPLAWLESDPTPEELAAADPRMLAAWQEQLLMMSTIPGPPES